MTRRSAVLLVLLVLVGALAGVVATLPAARALAWAGPDRLDAAGVTGSLWSGQARRVTFGGPAPVEDLSWDVAAWRLFTGRLAGTADFRLAGLEVDGQFAAAPGGRLAIRDATLKGPVGPVAQLAPLPVLAIDGEMLARVEEAVLQDRRPQMLRGRFQWQQARMIAPVQMDLGTVRGSAEPDAAGGHAVRLEASGGQVMIDGRVQLDADGSYRLDLTLTPAPDAPARIADTLGMFARRDGDAYVIRRSGQLAGR